MRVLLVEDDEALGDGLCVGLKQGGFTVDWLKEGGAAESAILKGGFDLVVLDLGLPGRAGLDILQNLRYQECTTPVLILTARDGVQDKVKALDAGADDYVVKPFDLDEVGARLRALQRRRHKRAAVAITHGDIELDPAARVVTRAGDPVILPRREFAVLEALLENRGRVMSRERLARSLYGWTEEVESNTVEVFVHHLRKKFGSHLIRTVRGVGYMIDKA